MNSHTHTQSQPHTHTLIHSYSLIHTCMYTHTYIPIHIQPLTYTSTHTLSHLHTWTHTLTHNHNHSNSQSHSHIHSYSLIHTHIHSHNIPIHTHTLTRTHPHTVIHTHSHTLTHTQPPACVAKCLRAVQDSSRRRKGLSCRSSASGNFQSDPVLGCNPRGKGTVRESIEVGAKHIPHAWKPSGLQRQPRLAHVRLAVGLARHRQRAFCSAALLVHEAALSTAAICQQLHAPVSSQATPLPTGPDGCWHRSWPLGLGLGTRFSGSPHFPVCKLGPPSTSYEADRTQPWKAYAALERQQTQFHKLSFSEHHWGRYG